MRVMNDDRFSHSDAAPPDKFQKGITEPLPGNIPAHGVIEGNKKPAGETNVRLKTNYIMRIK
jgi:hypothetical protein